MSDYVTGGRSSSGGSSYVTGGGSSTGGSDYVTGGGGGSRSKVKYSKGKKGKKHASVFGAVANLASDVSNAATGIPTGAIKAVEATAHDVRHDPVGELLTAAAGGPIGYAATHRKSSHVYKDVVKPTVDQYKYQYGPLAHGHVGEFVHRLYEHPLGPILDISALFTEGLSGAGRVGRGLAAAEKISPESKLARLGAQGERTLRSPSAMAGQDGPVLKIPTHAKSGVKVRQQAVDKGLKALDRKFLEANAKRGHVGRLAERFPAGLPFIGEVARYAREVDRLPRQDAVRLRLAAKPYADATRKFTPEQHAALQILGRGTTVEHLKQLWAHNETMQGVLSNPRVQELVAHPDAAMLKAYDAAKHLTAVDAELKIKRGLLTPAEAEARKYLPFRHEIGDTHVAPEDGQLEMFGNTLQDVKDKFAATGRPEPFYVPDVAVKQRVANSELALQGGGLGVPKTLGSSHHNTGVLWKTGQIALNHDVVGPEFMRTVKYSLFDDLHSSLVSSGIRVPKGSPLPHGYQYLRRSNSERIHALEKASGERIRSLETLIPDAEKIDSGAPGHFLHDLTTADAADALELHGDRVIVPISLAKSITGEFTRSNEALRLLKKPTKVWRTLVLGLRPGYLTNNVVGNTFLYFLHHPDVNGLRGLLNAVKREEGEGAVRKLLMDKSLPRPIREQFMEEFFPQHVQGTFIGTSDLSTGSGRVSAKAASVATFLPRLDKAYEGGLRRAAVEAALRKSPELKAAMKRMPKETREFEAAARQALTDNPQLERRISDDVDAALGNFRDLGGAEQALRAWAPFYAWYRAITVIAFKLAANNPLKAVILTKLGEIGNADLEKTLGTIEDFLHGAVPVGKRKAGYQRILTTQGLNPFSTVGQEAGALQAMLPGASAAQKKQLLGFISPFITGAGTDVTSTKASKYGVPGDVLAGVAGSLPQVSLYKALTQKPYAGPSRYKHTKQAAIASYFGVSLHDLNVAYENYKAAQAAAAK